MFIIKCWNGSIFYVLHKWQFRIRPCFFYWIFSPSRFSLIKVCKLKRVKKQMFQKMHPKKADFELLRLDDVYLQVVLSYTLSKGRFRNYVLSLSHLYYTTLLVCRQSYTSQSFVILGNYLCCMDHIVEGWKYQSLTKYFTHTPSIFLRIFERNIVA